MNNLYIISMDHSYANDYLPFCQVYSNLKKVARLLIKIVAEINFKAIELVIYLVGMTKNYQ